MHGHDSPVLDVNSSPSGHFFASVGSDKQVIVWRSNFDVYNEEQVESSPAPKPKKKSKYVNPCSLSLSLSPNPTSPPPHSLLSRKRASAAPPANRHSHPAHTAGNTSHAGPSSPPRHRLQPRAPTSHITPDVLAQDLSAQHIAHTLHPAPGVAVNTTATQQSIHASHLEQSLHTSSHVGNVTSGSHTGTIPASPTRASAGTSYQHNSTLQSQVANAPHAAAPDLLELPERLAGTLDRIVSQLGKDG
eukprot:TRINITY_DN937_c0_g4_i3.p1 TRINITY_DN937_c0_g4~~TRINITY_DN937_c0_g4_i3.p1  ORF type:complete len:279 (-),score=60.81 TRINITY_DN937_c0_g4_i3:620-1357(-)